jgi:hypothetical protein
MNFVRPSKDVALPGVGRRVKRRYRLCGKLMTKPRALPLRILPSADQNFLMRLGAGQVAGDKLSNGIVASRLPGWSILADRTHQVVHLVWPTGIEHLVDTGRDAVGKDGSGINQKIAGTPTRPSSALAMKVADAPTGQQRDLDRSEQLRSAEV